MISLLAESKTMSSLQPQVAEDIYLEHKPVFESHADAIMDYFSQLSPGEISSMLGISQSLGIKARNLAYDFNYKGTGYKAINGYTGEVFKGLDIDSIPKDLLVDLNDKLRIVSSVYGLLKPEDIIKPYRCEFNKSITKDHKTSVQVYRQKITIEFSKYIKENKVKDVINLLPADADKCFDWKIIRAFTSVHKIVFQVYNEKGNLKTPSTKRLKELRGLMFRTILENVITNFEDLKSFDSPYFLFSKEHSKTLLPMFISTE